jgi:hypothetical protein
MSEARKERKRREDEERKEKNLQGRSGVLKEKKSLGDSKTKTNQIHMNVNFKNSSLMFFLSSRIV